MDIVKNIQICAKNLWTLTQEIQGMTFRNLRFNKCSKWVLLIRHGKQWHQEFICKVRKKSPQEGSVYPVWFHDFIYLFIYFYFYSSMSPHSQYRPGKGPAWAEVYMGWTYSASSFYTVSVRTQPVVSIRRPDFMILKRWRKSRRWREVRYELIIGRYVGLCREQNSISIDVIYKNWLSQ